MGLLQLLCVAVLVTLCQGHVNAVFDMHGTVQQVEKCCKGKPANWFSLWHSINPNTTSGDAFNYVNQLSVTSWQHKDTYFDADELVDYYRRKSLVYQGPNGLITSSNGLVKLASCGTIQPWIIDSTFESALKANSRQLLTWNNSYWGLPIAFESNVLYYNKALAPEGPSANLTSFVAQAADCSRGMALQLDLDSMAGFFVGTTLFPAENTCANTAEIRAVFQLLNNLAKESCVVQNATRFEQGEVAFLNGAASDLGRYEALLGQNLGVAALPRLVFDGSSLDTRSPLSQLTLYSSSTNSRQAFRDYAIYASSQGQAGIWQNRGRNSISRMNVTEGVELLRTLDSISDAAFVQPNSFWWWGLRGNAGFEKAFSPLVGILGGLMTDAVAIAQGVQTACNCMNTNMC